MSLLSPQLEAFVSVVNHNTVHAAADALHLTQTAVTQRIRSLEAKLKTTLFLRSRRGMLLTPEGEALLRYCHATIALEGEALAKIQSPGTQATVTLKIAGPSSVMHSRVIPACAEILKRYPNLLITFDIVDTETRHEMLRAGHADIALMFEEDRAQEMCFKLLKPEQYVLVCCPAWKGRRLRDIISDERIIDFNPQDQATFQYLKQFTLIGYVKHGRHFLNQTEGLATLVSLGLGYTTLPKELAKPLVDKGDLILLNQGKSYPIQYGIAWYDRPEPPAYFADVIKAIQ